MTVMALPARLRSSLATSQRAGRDPAWARLSLAGLLAATLVAYLWDLGRNGYANDFYAAAVQAGTHSWKAFFFGSFDSGNFITVDKTPASLWVMELSGRVFGFSSWSMLVPQALEGAGSVWLVYACVKRWFGPGAGLLSGAVLALTPVAALMFRFNNPDALLVLLMTGAGYAVTRALERDRTRWLVLAGVLVGLAFLAKMMQAFLVVPGFGLAYLWAGPARLRRRLWQLAAALGGIIAGAGWWVAIAQLWPAGSRPYFGGSTSNSILQLALGYNGLGRLNGTETGSIGWNGSSVAGTGRTAGGATGGAAGGAGGPGGGGGFGGSTGILRLFHSEFAGQVSWLLPAALLALAALLWVSRRAVRTDRTRAFALLWGGWLLVTALTFSYMQGIIHPYYLVALAPAIAALIGAGAMSLFPASLVPASVLPGASRPEGLGWVGRATAAAGVLMTAVVAFILLNQTPAWLPWLRWVIVVAGVLAAAAILTAGVIRARRLGRMVGLAALGLSLVAGLAGPLAYTVETVNSTHTGSIPSAGPAVAGSFGGPGGGQPGGARAGGAVPAGGVPGGAGGFGGFPGGTGAGTGTGTGTGAGTGTGTGAGTGGGPSAAGGAGGGMGGLSGSTTVSSALIKLLEQDASKYKWIAATEGSQSAAPIELATGGEAVMAIGGFNGSDPAPTLAQFEAMVARHEIHYYVGRGSNSFGGGSGASAIESWVAAHFKSETVGGTTVYDLTQAK
jgi:4-amino-4-deoxy-L-arabinose transferase-like glycosyltransferase